MGIRLYCFTLATPCVTFLVTDPVKTPFCSMGQLLEAPCTVYGYGEVRTILILCIWTSDIVVVSTFMHIFCLLFRQKKSSDTIFLSQLFQLQHDCGHRGVLQYRELFLNEWFTKLNDGKMI